MKSIKNYINEGIGPKATEVGLPELKALRELIKAEDWEAVENYDTSKLRKMDNLFKDVKGIKDLDLSKWDVSKVRSMTRMFDGSDFDNDSLKDWDPWQVVNMSWMFANSEFNGNLANWNTPNLEVMDFMFMNSKFNNASLKRWKNLDRLKSKFHMFLGAKIGKRNLPKWYSSFTW